MITVIIANIRDTVFSIFSEVPQTTRRMYLYYIFDKLPKKVNIHKKTGIKGFRPFTFQTAPKAPPIVVPTNCPPCGSPAFVYCCF